MSTTVMPSLPASTFGAVNDSVFNKPRTTLHVKSSHGTQSQIISSPYFPHSRKAGKVYISRANFCARTNGAGRDDNNLLRH